MAEGTIISFAQKLGVIILKEYQSLQKVEGQVVSLRDEMEWISSFLRDAALQRSTCERVDVWVSQIRDLAYDAEDALDIYIHKVKLKQGKGWLRCLSIWPIKYPGPPITLHKLQNKICSINGRMEKISAFKSRYAIDKLGQKDSDSLGQDVAVNEKRAPLDAEENLIIGLDTHSEEVKKKLLIQGGGESSQGESSIQGGREIHGEGEMTQEKLLIQEGGEPSQEKFLIQRGGELWIPGGGESSQENLLIQGGGELSLEKMSIQGGESSQGKMLKGKLSIQEGGESSTQGGGESSQLHVVSIVGMGGSGKSTLASKVYNEVKDQFDSHAWINVSQEFESRRLLESILEQTGGKENLEKLLVVFDDVWSKKDWDALCNGVLNKIKTKTKIDESGSRILITSRFHEVGNYASGEIEPYLIGLLDPKDSLELLRSKVFRDKDFPTEELKTLGKKIVNKCGNLPLAIVVLGGLLSTKQRTYEVWDKVAQSARWQLLQGSTECKEVLGLSYDNLPNFLKPCFLYFGFFPEDDSIDCENLIQLWIAEGFIQERGEELMEDVAEDYLEDLVQRNMIKVDNRRSNGSLERCSIHDLLREFAISKGRHEKFLDILVNERSATTLRMSMSRRLAVHSINDDESDNRADQMLDSSSLNNPRSIMCFTNLSNAKLEDKSFYESFTYLRVLDLRGVRELESLPNEVGKLVLLKYLSLRGVRIKKLPSTIRNLQNLRTLNISGTRISVIPESVWELVELRHFYSIFSPYSNLSDTSKRLSCGLLRMVKDNCLGGGAPPQIGRLRNLLTLFARGENWISNDFSLLTNLRKLKITGVNMDVEHGKVLSSSIHKFICLRELDIEWDQGKLKLPSFEQHVHLYNMRLVGKIKKLRTDHPNVFPPNLIDLELSNTKLNQDGLDTLAKVSNLKFLNLEGESFSGEQMVFPEKGFPNLIQLAICMLSELKVWKVEKESLPKLKYLCLRKLKNLEELPDGLVQVTTLETLTLIDMRAPEFVARVRRNGCDWAKIQQAKIIRSFVGDRYEAWSTSPPAE